MQTKSGSFNTGTGAVGTDIVITGVGFKPDLVIFSGTRLTQTTDGIKTTDPGHAAMNIGWMINDNADGAPTARRAVGSISADAATSGESGCQMRDDAVVMVLTSNGVVDGQADGKTFDADGFTLVVDIDFFESNRVHYLAIKKDSDITNIASGRQVPPTATGNVAYTGPGFRPDFVLFAGCRETIINTPSPHGVLTIGAATSSTKRGVCTICSLNGNTTMFTDGYGYAGECLAFPLPAATNPQTLQARADFVSMDTNGFTLNWLEAVNPNASQFMWLAIKGGQWDVYNALTQINTTTEININNGFQPLGGMVVSAMRAQSTQDVMTAHVGLSVGLWATATDERCFFINDEDGAATSLTAAGVEHDSVYGSFVLTTQAINGLMQVTSVDTDGVNFLMSNADAAQNFFWGWSCAAAAATGTPLRMLMGVGI